MPVAKVNLAEKLALFSEVYKPKIVGEVNDFHVKVVKIQGDFGKGNVDSSLPY